MVKATSILRTAFAIILIAPLAWSCNNKKEDKKEEKTEVKDTTPVVTPMAPDSNTMLPDTTNQEKPKGEQTPPPKN